MQQQIFSLMFTFIRPFCSNLKVTQLWDTVIRSTFFNFSVYFLRTFWIIYRLYITPPGCCVWLESITISLCQLTSLTISSPLVWLLPLASGQVFKHSSPTTGLLIIRLITWHKEIIIYSSHTHNSQLVKYLWWTAGYTLLNHKKRKEF
jgi:hypothetical protein